MQATLDRLITEAGRAGFQVNAGRTLQTRAPTRASTLESLRVGEDQFVYLGSEVTSVDQYIGKRVQLSQFALRKLRTVWDSAIPALVNAELFSSSNVSILFYGFESWALSQSQLARFVTAYTRLLRRALAPVISQGLGPTEQPPKRNAVVCSPPSRRLTSVIVDARSAPSRAQSEPDTYPGLLQISQNKANWRLTARMASGRAVESSRTGQVRPYDQGAETEIG